jgi:AAA domain/Bifunctional DNA primase/polymerase, N-terminal/Primase C terminal 2 (PriCT-2)
VAIAVRESAMSDQFYNPNAASDHGGNLKTDPGQTEQIDSALSMLDAALAYAKNGLPVFPAVRGQKKSHKSAEHSNGVRWGATRDPKTIRRDFGKWQTANIGIPTGTSSGFFVVEADTLEGHGVDGIASLRALEDQHGKLPDTQMVISPSGSEHYCFQQPPDIIIKNSASEIAPGVDVRGEGGMVLVPPSVKPGVGVYRELNRLPFAVAPDWLIELCKFNESLYEYTPDDDQGEVDSDEVTAAVRILPNHDCNWEKWNNTGMAIYRATNGSDAGFKAFDRWSRKSKKYNENKTREKWFKAYRSCPPLHIGAKHLFKLAEAEVPGWQAEYQSAVLDSIRNNTSSSSDYDPGDTTADDSATADEAPGPAPDDAKTKTNDQAGQQKTQGKKSPKIFWHGEPTGRELKPWLVKDLIPEVGTGLTSGQWGACKTFAMLDLAGSVATGLPFAGYEIARRGGVLFIAAEGAREVESRLQGLEEAKLKPAALVATVKGKPIAADVNLDHLPFGWIEESPHLKAADSFKRLAESVREVADQMKQKFGVDLALIIIDTFSKSAEIDNPDSSAENQKIFNGLDALSAATGAFVLVVDHFGKNPETGTRGTSAKEDTVDVVLAMLAERSINGEVSNTRMALRKCRGGAQGTVTPFNLVVVDMADKITGEAFTTCVVEWQPMNRTKGGATATSKKVPQSLKLFMAAMRAAVSRLGRATYPWPTGPEVIAVTEAQLRDEFYASYPADDKETKRKTYKRALDKARADGLVRSREIDGVDHLWLPETTDEQDADAEPF